MERVRGLRTALAVAVVAQLAAGPAGASTPTSRVQPGHGQAGALIQVAQLVATNTNEALQNVVVAGDTVFGAAPGASVGSRPGTGAVFVFAKPAGGWSGRLHEVAVLTPSTGSIAAGARMVVSGTTLFVGARNGSAGQVDVFEMPAGGWSGQIHESASLTAPGESTAGDLGSAIAVSGSTVVASSRDAAALYVFQEPAGGWSGTVPDVAKLTITDPDTDTSGPVPTGLDFGASVAISGQTIVGGEAPAGPSSPGTGYVYTEPAGGWHSETQSARLTDPNGHLFFGLPLYGGGATAIALSDQTIALPVQTGSGNSFGKGAVDVFSQPAGGWSGNVTPSATLTASDGTSIAGPVMAGQTVFAAGGGNAYAFNPPTGGWSGSITESAELKAPGTASCSGVVGIDGSDVVCGGSVSGQTIVSLGSAAVFTEPAGGWSGTVPATASLIVPSPPTSGAAYVYAEGSQGWSSGPPTATLVPSGDLDGAIFGSVAAAAGAVVANSGQMQEDYPGSYYFESGDSLFVFQKPSGGWTNQTQTARLTATDDAALGAPAMSGSVIAAAGGGRVYVFERGPGGWTDGQHESAILPAGDGRGLAVSDQAVAVDDQNHVDVFPRPASGWSQPIGPPAELDFPVGYALTPGPLAISGAIVVAGGANHATGRSVSFVFVEPAAGWVGQLRPSAQLTVPGPPSGYGAVSSLAISGRYVFAGEIGRAGVYAEPSRGWSGSIAPTARLMTGSGSEDVVVDQNTLLAIGQQQCGSGHYVEPCASLSVFDEPFGGWTARPTIPASYSTGTGPTSAAVIGRTVFTNTTPLTVEQFVPEVGRVTATGQRLAGLAVGKPRLRIGLRTGASALPLRSIAITLPRGLRAARSASALRKGLSIPGASWRVSASRGRLIIRFKVPNYSADISLRYPGLQETPWIEHHARTVVKATPRKRHLRFRLSVVMTDAAGHLTRMTLPIQFR